MNGAGGLPRYESRRPGPGAGGFPNRLGGLFPSVAPVREMSAKETGHYYRESQTQSEAVKVVLAGPGRAHIAGPGGGGSGSRHTIR